MPGSFFDSNVLLYLASEEEPKRLRALELVHTGGAISVQCLNEVMNVGRRKKHLPWPTLHAFLQTLRSLLVVNPITIEIHELGLKLAERYQLATYDAMIVAAALLADCDILWTEDMHDGLHVAGKLSVINPFRAIQDARR